MAHSERGESPPTQGLTAAFGGQGVVPNLASQLLRLDPSAVICGVERGQVGVSLGLDVGAVSAKLAALGGPADRDAMLALCTRRGFRLFDEATPDGERLCLSVSECRRLAGNPRQSAFELLRELYEVVPAASVRGLRVTGSGGKTIAEILGVRFENEFKAIARMMGVFYPQVRTVFEIGGESSKYIRLEREAGRCSIADYDRSGECAAGTGSFLDQQALRMGYSVEEIGGLVSTAKCAARIAGRCSVFAKTDMIHAQQKGYTPAEILRGLCDAVARNFKSSIVRGKPVIAPVAMVGAVSQNAGVTAALHEVFDLDEAELFVPELYAWCGAAGAALLEAEETSGAPLPEIQALCRPESQQRAPAATPLSMENVVLLRERPARFVPPSDDAAIPAYLGIDVGSVSTNVVAIDESGAVIHDVYLRTAGRPIEAVQQGLAEVEALWGRRLRIQGAGTTGSGRELIAEFVGADVVNDEITAHKTGAVYVSKTLGDELVDTIFEIGGQDSKFIAIENGVVVDFAMNEACAAGTGSFLEEQAEKLGISIKEEFARLALAAPAPAPLGERCTVFMEREVTARLQRGESVPNLAAGLANSIALNYLNRVVRGKRIGQAIYFQGGTAYNDAVAAAFAGLLGKRVIVPPYNGVIGAIGMALIARQWQHATGRASRFRGYDLKRLRVTTRDFVCRACSNLCDMKQFTIEGQKSYWGDKCSDKFRKPCVTGRQPVIEDLFAFREQLLAELTKQPERAAGQVRVGVPCAMSTHERYPFWHRYFTALGMQVVLSPPTDPKITADGIELALAQPCYPVQIAHGHVQALLGLGVDYVLIPNILDAESEEGSSCISHQCPWNQTLPWVLRSSPRLEPQQHKFLAPTLHFQLGRKPVQRALAGLASRLGVTRRASDRAVKEAYAAQQEFQGRLLEAGRRALDALARTGEPGVLLAGRSYNIYDRSVNCDIPRKLRHHYGVNVIPLDFAVTGREPMADLHENMYWTSGRKILAAAQLAASRPNLHIIYLSNFKCGPDSYLKYFARHAAGAPLLMLQFDGHGNDAGYLTRCEAYLDSKGILQCFKPQQAETGTA